MRKIVLFPSSIAVREKKKGALLKTVPRFFIKGNRIIQEAQQVLRLAAVTCHPQGTFGTQWTFIVGVLTGL
jgi:hypothetical protein